MSEEEPDARALRESEQRFRALAVAAREAIFRSKSKAAWAAARRST